MDFELTAYQNAIGDIREIIRHGRDAAYQAVSSTQVLTNWSIGKRIVEQEQCGANRAEYGKHMIVILAEQLSNEFGSGYSLRNLQYYRKFYLCFRDFKIVNARVHNLSWTHFRSLLRVEDEETRLWYMREAAEENWSARTLDRNISTQYYYRLLRAPKKEAVIDEMKHRTTAEQKGQFELIKSPVIAEFLGFKAEDTILKAIWRRRSCPTSAIS